jgi:enolase-phosphatase E1
VSGGGPSLLLDIEGTTTPVAFVTEVLFPLARRRLREFLAAHANEPEVVAQIDALEREHAAEISERPPGWNPGDRVGSAVAYGEWLMDRDRKTTPLKTLQGMIWQDGYASGALEAIVYDDVRPAFERWRSASRAIAIFSSGSVLAQRLLFAHTNAGDLTPFLTAYFDTTTGPKREAASYARIAGTLSRPAQELLFVSDVVAELDAAAGAGLSTALCVRPGGAEPSPGPHTTIRSFGELD